MIIEAANLTKKAGIEIGNRNYLIAIFYIDGALRIMSADLSFNGTLAVLYRQKSYCYRCLGEYIEAVKCIKLSLEADPKYGQAYFDLGFLQGYTNQIDEAIRNFEKAIEFKCDDPKLTQVYYILSGAYFRKSHEMSDGNEFEVLAKKSILKKGLEIIKKAIEAESNNFSYYLLAGNICLWLDRQFDPVELTNTKYYLSIASEGGIIEASNLLREISLQ